MSSSSQKSSPYDSSSQISLIADDLSPYIYSPNTDAYAYYLDPTPSDSNQEGEFTYTDFLEIYEKLESLGKSDPSLKRALNSNKFNDFKDYLKNREVGNVDASKFLGKEAVQIRSSNFIGRWTEKPILFEQEIRPQSLGLEKIDYENINRIRLFLQGQISPDKLNHNLNGKILIRNKQTGTLHLFVLSEPIFAANLNDFKLKPGYPLEISSSKDNFELVELYTSDGFIAVENSTSDSVTSLKIRNPNQNNIIKDLKYSEEEMKALGYLLNQAQSPEDIIRLHTQTLNLAPASHLVRYIEILIASPLPEEKYPQEYKIRQRHILKIFGEISSSKKMDKVLEELKADRMADDLLYFLEGPYLKELFTLINKVGTTIGLPPVGNDKREVLKVQAAIDGGTGFLNIVVNIDRFAPSLLQAAQHANYAMIGSTDENGKPIQSPFSIISDNDDRVAKAATNLGHDHTRRAYDHATSGIDWAFFSSGAIFLGQTIWKYLPVLGIPTGFNIGASLLLDFREEQNKFEAKLAQLVEQSYDEYSQSSFFDAINNFRRNTISQTRGLDEYFHCSPESINLERVGILGKMADIGDNDEACQFYAAKAIEKMQLNHANYFLGNLLSQLYSTYYQMRKSGNSREEIKDAIAKILSEKYPQQLLSSLTSNAPYMYSPNAETLKKLDLHRVKMKRLGLGRIKNLDLLIYYFDTQFDTSIKYNN